MKKTIILILIFLFIGSGFAFTSGDNQEEKTGKSKQSSKYLDAVTKTYSLKHVSPSTVQRALRPYFWECSYDRNGNMLTVKIGKENISTFEKLLKQLDVEKKKILVRIFTVIASNKGKGSAIENKDLREVLNQLQKVLSFKFFQLDGVSALTVADGQHHSRLLLSSHSPLRLTLGDIYIKGGGEGQRSIGFDFRLEQKAEPFFVDGKYVYETLIESQTSVKENGYLVAGVSKIGNGDSLVLVINAEIK